MHIKRVSQRWTAKFEVKPGSWVFVPTDETLKYGNIIKKSIESKWSPPNYYYHLRDGGHVKALMSHINHQFFIHLDILNYFGCINKSRVTRALKRYWSYSEARDIASQSTVRDPSISSHIKFILPFGFVQSPIIASLCLQTSKLGRYLSKLNMLSEVSVSVYMDDIIISSNDINKLNIIINRIRPIAEFSKFPLNPNKEQGPSDSITAFNIELSKGFFQITEERLEEFKIAYQESDNFNVLNGILGYVATVNQDQLKEILHDMCHITKDS